MSKHSIWIKRVQEWRQSGLTAKQFCEGRDFAVTSLQSWSSRLNRHAAPAPPTVAIARVMRAPQASHSRLRVELANVVLDLPADAEPDFVAALAHAVLHRTRSPA